MACTESFELSVSDHEYNKGDVRAARQRSLVRLISITGLGKTTIRGSR